MILCKCVGQCTYSHWWRTAHNLPAVCPLGLRVEYKNEYKGRVSCVYSRQESCCRVVCTHPKNQDLPQTKFPKAHCTIERCTLFEAR